MKLTNEAKRDILDLVLSLIAAISDIEYQKRVWIRGEGPECDDFDETCCHFFDDGDPVIKHYKDYGITENQHHLLVKFRDEFRAFSRKHDLPEEFIHTPEWKKIMNRATEVLKVFSYTARG